MSDYYGVNHSDEYLEHWGIAKGGAKQGHKYLFRYQVGNGKWRYIYTPAEYAAWMRGGARNGSKGVGYKGGGVAGAIGNRLGKLARVIRNTAGGAISKLTGRKAPRANNIKKPGRSLMPDNLNAYSTKRGSVTEAGKEAKESRDSREAMVAKAARARRRGKNRQRPVDKSEYSKNARSDMRQKTFTKSSTADSSSAGNWRHGKANSVRGQKKLTTQRSARDPRAQLHSAYNPTTVKATVPKKIPLFGTKTVDVSILGRPPRNTKQKSKGDSPKKRDYNARQLAYPRLKSRRARKDPKK